MEQSNSVCQIASSIIDMFKAIALTSSHSSIQAGGSMHTSLRIPWLVIIIFHGHHSFCSDYRCCQYTLFEGTCGFSPGPSGNSESLTWACESCIPCEYYVAIPFGTLPMRNQINTHTCMYVCVYIYIHKNLSKHGVRMHRSMNMLRMPSFFHHKRHAVLLSANGIMLIVVGERFVRILVVSHGFTLKPSSKLT